MKVNLQGYHLLNHALLNKGMAFPESERLEFDLCGLLPPRIATLSEQCLRSYTTFKRKSGDLERYLYLRDLQDSNETLFYSLLESYLEELLPFIYTPTVGLACQTFSHTYRRPRGLFISYPYRDRIDQILAQPYFDQVEVIVVSDGERILGLGDQGAGGMGIPIGKLALYTACAGIHPASTLPILLDTGTNNPDLIADPLYLGWGHERIRGQAYDDFIESFVQAVKKRFPQILLQWEDFAQQNAAPLLERYRDRLCTFNDDIQGTAAVAVGTLLAAVHVTGIPLKDQRIVVVGAGSAGCGISELIVQAMQEEGLAEQEARNRIFLVDRQGLLTQDMLGLTPEQQRFAQPVACITDWQSESESRINLLDVVKNVKPSLLIGVCGQPNIFTEPIVREMAKHVQRPIIFPLSNPTHRSEASPADLMLWTQGRVLVSTGSPFGEVKCSSGVSYRIDQTNNAYIFPGMGLGLLAAKAQKVTDKMFMVAAKALADCSPTHRDPKANLLPPFSEIRQVSFQVALAVAQEVMRAGLSNLESYEDLPKLIQSKMWKPVYLPYRKA